MLSGWGLEGICNLGSCLHGGEGDGDEGDGDANRAHIQSASKLGMRAGTIMGTAEQSKRY